MEKATVLRKTFVLTQGQEGSLEREIDAWLRQNPGYEVSERRVTGEGQVRTCMVSIKPSVL